jgi:hypothetical protein
MGRLPGLAGRALEAPEAGEQVAEGDAPLEAGERRARAEVAAVAGRAVAQDLLDAPPTAIRDRLLPD